MARPPKQEKGKRRTVQVRLDAEMMLTVRMLAGAEGIDAPDWIERSLRPVIMRDVAKLQGKLNRIVSNDPSQ